MHSKFTKLESEYNPHKLSNVGKPPVAIRARNHGEVSNLNGSPAVIVTMLVSAAARPALAPAAFPAPVLVRREPHAQRSRGRRQATVT